MDIADGHLTVFEGQGILGADTNLIDPHTGLAQLPYRDLAVGVSAG